MIYNKKCNFCQFLNEKLNFWVEKFNGSSRMPSGLIQTPGATMTTYAHPSTKMIHLPGGHLAYAKSFLPQGEAANLLNELLHETPWETHRFPRLVAWYGDFAYCYSGVVHPAAAWPSSLARLRTQVETFCFGESRGQFQGVLLNLYRNGYDSVGFHSDNEPMLRRGAPIASLSLGATRTFLLNPDRRSNLPNARPQQLELDHDSLLVMGGRLQDHWVHSVPKDPSVRSPRVNLTFRCYTMPR